MKKKYLYIVAAIIILTMIFLSGCTESQEVIFYPELSRYNIVRSDSKNEFSFNITALSDKKDFDVKFISAEGVNTDSLDVHFTNDTFKDIKDKKMNGKYVTLLGLHIKSIHKYTKIETMKLEVDGNIVNLEFTSPVENTFYDSANIEHVLFQRNLPIYVFPQTFAGQDKETFYNFTLEATQDISIRSFKFRDWLEITKGTVYINDRFIGDLESSLPLKLKKEDILTVKGQIKLNDKSLSGKENIITNIIIDCTYGDKNVSEYYPFSAVFIGNRDDAKAFMEYVDK